jgi:hypothetical protein
VRSFAALRAEVPSAHATMCARLAPRRLVLRVDDEAVGLRFAPAEATFVGASRNPAVELATSRRTILDMIDGRHTLLTAVLAELMWLRGRPADVLAFHDGLTIYLHGGVRAPSFRHLLAEFRGEGREGRR